MDFFFSLSAATGPAICIILASYVGCDRNAAMAYFVLSMALMGGFYSGMKVKTKCSYLLHSLNIILLFSLLTLQAIFGFVFDIRVLYIFKT